MYLIRSPTAVYLQIFITNRASQSAHDPFWRISTTVDDENIRRCTNSYCTMLCPCVMAFTSSLYGIYLKKSMFFLTIMAKTHHSFRDNSSGCSFMINSNTIAEAFLIINTVEKLLPKTIKERTRKKSEKPGKKQD